MIYIKKFLNSGKAVEKQFAELFEKTSFATEKEDMFQHWDVEVNYKIDVKGLKKTSRKDLEVNENIHWVEIKNVNGNLGWTYSETTDFFAFETIDYWIIISPKNLQELIKTKVKKERVESPSLYKLYSRVGRKDVLTLVKTIDLIHFSDCTIKKLN